MPINNELMEYLSSKLFVLSTAEKPDPVGSLTAIVTPTNDEYEPPLAGVMVTTAPLAMLIATVQVAATRNVPPLTEQLGLVYPEPEFCERMTR